MIVKLSFKQKKNEQKPFNLCLSIRFVIENSLGNTGLN